MKILVVRTDRLGDVVLSLPVFAYLKGRQPGWRLEALVAPGSVPLVENDPAIDAVWTHTDDGLPALEHRLAAEGFDAAILLFYQRSLAAALRRCGIPRRIGPLSKWSSWFLLNRGVWQNRSRVRYHERDYNLKLAEKLVVRGDTYPEPRIHLTEGQREIGRQFRSQQASDAGQVVFVHPGSGGSALNWEPARFSQLANELAARTDTRVFVTGSETDRAVIQSVQPGLDPRVQVIAERYSLREFLGVLSGADLLIGPSTGPLHIAAALDVAVIGLYPPVPTQSMARWGPRGPRSRALAPGVRCPARLVCFAERCRHYDCMAGIEVQEVVSVAARVLDRP